MSAAMNCGLVRLPLWLVSAILLTTLAVSAQTNLSQRGKASRSDGQLTSLKVRPSETDPAIRTFNTPHHVYINETLASDGSGKRPSAHRGLLLWLPGTQQGESEGPGGAAAFCQRAADLGYYVIILKYPNNQSATVCREDSDPAAFEKFRLTLIAGGSSPHVTLPRPESIEHRLIMLLAHLEKTRPQEDWDRFLVGNTPTWSAITVAGQSQGGGHAALMGVKHRVARVICFGAPKDYSVALGTSAAWLQQESATPKHRFFAFNHDQDRQGCSPAQQLENLHALGLHAFGPPVDVLKESPPFRHTRILTTNHPSTKVTSKAAHTTAINSRHAALFNPAWTYLLTEPTP